MTKQTIEVGSKVAMSAAFLKAIACHTGDMPAARGEVIKFEPIGLENMLAVVRWHNWPGVEESRVLVVNLALVGPNSKFCAC